MNDISALDVVEDIKQIILDTVDFQVVEGQALSKLGWDQDDPSKPLSRLVVESIFEIYAGVFANVVEHIRSNQAGRGSDESDDRDSGGG
jgi:hypothetical protein